MKNFTIIESTIKDLTDMTIKTNDCLEFLMIDSEGIEFHDTVDLLEVINAPIGATYQVDLDTVRSYGEPVVIETVVLADKQKSNNLVEITVDYNSYDLENETRRYERHIYVVDTIAMHA